VTDGGGSGIYNAQQLRGAIGKEVRTIAGIEPDFVSPAPAFSVFNSNYAARSWRSLKTKAAWPL
jgi:hypothetical protein